MLTQFDTCFFERYAKVTLETILGEKYAHLINADRPDLQDNSKGLGIEVTRAMRENKNEAHLMINKLAGENIFDIPKNDFQQIMQYGYVYGLRPELELVGEVEHYYWLLALPLKRILENKVSKVGNGYYGNYKEFGLYVFFKDSLEYNEIDIAMDYVLSLQANLEQGYSKLFISQIQRLYVCDLEKKSIESYPISVEQCRDFYSQAIQIC